MYHDRERDRGLGGDIDGEGTLLIRRLQTDTRIRNDAAGIACQRLDPQGETSGLLRIVLELQGQRDGLPGATNGVDIQYGIADDLEIGFWWLRKGVGRPLQKADCGHHKQRKTLVSRSLGAFGHENLL